MFGKLSIRLWTPNRPEVLGDCRGRFENRDLFLKLGKLQYRGEPVGGSVRPIEVRGVERNPNGVVAKGLRTWRIEVAAFFGDKPHGDTDACSRAADTSDCVSVTPRWDVAGSTVALTGC